MPQVPTLHSVEHDFNDFSSEKLESSKSFLYTFEDNLKANCAQVCKYKPSPLHGIIKIRSPLNIVIATKI